MSSEWREFLAFALCEEVAVSRAERLFPELVVSVVHDLARVALKERQLKPLLLSLQFPVCGRVRLPLVPVGVLRD
jgi:uncharacterized protein (DUF608 family)